MKKVQSADDTTIVFDQLGKGSAIILVGGALEQRAMESETAQLAPLLAQHFTVFHYDRRGRGDSTDTQPYAVEREPQPGSVFVEFLNHAYNGKPTSLSREEIFRICEITVGAHEAAQEGKVVKLG